MSHTHSRRWANAILAQIGQTAIPLTDWLQIYLDDPWLRHPGATWPQQLDLATLTTALKRLPPQAFVAKHWHWVPTQPGQGPKVTLNDTTLHWVDRFSEASLLDIASAALAAGFELQKAQRLCGALLRSWSARGLPPGGQAQAQTALAETLHCDLNAMAEADRQLRGKLWSTLLGFEGWPVLDIDPQIVQPTASLYTESKIEAVRAALSQTGWRGEPLALMIGPEICLDALSPYARDLESLLLQWAEESPAWVGNDLHKPYSPHQLVALAHDFLQTDPGLRTERRDQERSAGVHHHHHEGMRWTSVDLRRLDPEASHPHLSEILVNAPERWLLHWPTQAKLDLRAITQALCETLGERLDAVLVISTQARPQEDAEAQPITKLFHPTSGERAQLPNASQPSNASDAPLALLPSRRLAAQSDRQPATGPQPALLGLADAHFFGPWPQGRRFEAWRVAGPPRFRHRSDAQLIQVQLRLVIDWLTQLCTPNPAQTEHSDAPATRRGPSRRALAARIKA